MGRPTTAVLVTDDPSDPTAVARQFFDALHKYDWRAAAELIDDEAAGELRSSKLTSVVAWIEHRDAMRLAQEQGMAYG